MLRHASKYFAFPSQHDPKTPDNADGFIMLHDECRRALVVRALEDLAPRGVCSCKWAIAGNSTVLEKCRNLQPRAILTAMHRTTWENLHVVLQRASWWERLARISNSKAPSPECQPLHHGTLVFCRLPNTFPCFAALSQRRVTPALNAGARYGYINASGMDRLPNSFTPA